MDNKVQGPGKESISRKLCYYLVAGQSNLFTGRKYMSMELMMLLYSTILFFVIILAQAALAIHQNGLMAQAGSRDELPEPSVLRMRLQRLTANLQENLVMFAAIVLIANAANISNETTVMGATIFLYTRLAHAIVYAFGWPMIRPLFYFASLYGMIIIALEILKV
jgi:uncharacterized MAPEG superfamily protein